MVSKELRQAYEQFWVSTQPFVTLWCERGESAFNMKLMRKPINYWLNVCFVLLSVFSLVDD